MEKKSLFRFYAFGYNYNNLQSRQKIGSLSSQIVHDITTFINECKDLNLPVTLKIASKLEKLEKKISKYSKADSKLLDEDAQTLYEIMQNIDPALDAELQLKEAYILTEKNYLLENLMEKPDRLLNENVYSSLSENAKRDFALACIQIALDQPTGATFHLMRSIEEQLKELYFHFKKTKRLARPMWGPMIQELRNKKSKKPTEPVLNHLDSIRIHFRNPTQHPGVFYNMDEAQDLLNQAISALNMIKREMAR